MFVYVLANEDNNWIMKRFVTLSSEFMKLREVCMCDYECIKYEFALYFAK